MPMFRKIRDFSIAFLAIGGLSISSAHALSCSDRYDSAQELFNDSIISWNNGVDASEDALEAQDYGDQDGFCEYLDEAIEHYHDAGFYADLSRDEIWDLNFECGWDMSDRTLYDVDQMDRDAYDMVDEAEDVVEEYEDIYYDEC